MGRSPRRTRTASRVAAVQALFQSEQAQDNPETVIDQFVRHRLGELPGTGGFEDGRVPDAEVALFARIVRAAVAQQDTIDRMLAEALPADWPLARIDPVLRALMRAGTAELAMADGPPAKVVINEYLDVARSFFTGAEPGMANADAGSPGAAVAARGVRMSDSIIGTGSYRYRFQRDWAKLPRWWNFGEADLPGPPRTSVKGAVAANGDVYVLCRAAHPVLVFDAEGRFVTSWGEGQFSSFVHGLTIDPSGNVWIADSGLHTVTEHKADGTLLRTLGMRGAAAPTLYGKPFNMPTGVAFASSGEIFVSDGYGNRRVHCFSSDGELKHSWGQPGAGPGQFALVHFITADAEDRLYVCDRENHRIQIFATTGEVLAQWTGFDHAERSRVRP